MMELDAKRLKALDEMLAREEIRECLLRYARGMDRHDTALVSSAYHADAIDDHTSYIGFGKDLGPYANAVHDAMWEAHQHFVTNTTIDLDGDTAHVESYLIGAGRRKQNTGTDINGGRYVDRFEKRDGRWAIAVRILVYEWGLPAEGAIDPLKSYPLGTQGPSDVSFMRPLRIWRNQLK